MTAKRRAVKLSAWYCHARHPTLGAKSFIAIAQNPRAAKYHVARLGFGLTYGWAVQVNPGIISYPHAWPIEFAASPIQRA